MPPPTDGSGLAAQFVEWIAAAQQGSKEALGDVLEACRQYLLLMANQELDPKLRGKIGPSDVVQQTVLEAVRDFGQFQGHTEGELLAWLRGILLHNVANVTRAYRGTEMRDVNHEMLLDQVPAQELLDSALLHTETPSAQVSSREQAQRVDRAVEQLPPHYGEVIRLRHQEGLSFEEIGQRLGCSAEAARKLWARAIEQLQQVLGANKEGK